jgi:hypothetical protein
VRSRRSCVRRIQQLSRYQPPLNLCACILRDILPSDTMLRRLFTPDPSVNYLFLLVVHGVLSLVAASLFVAEHHFKAEAISGFWIVVRYDPNPVARRSTVGHVTGVYADRSFKMPSNPLHSILACSRHRASSSFFTHWLSTPSPSLERQRQQPCPRRRSEAS